MDIGKICEELKGLQRQRSVIIKSRIMQENRLRSVVATDLLGYYLALGEKERTRLFKEATDLIKQVMKGKKKTRYDPLIRTTMAGVEGFEVEQERIEGQMIKWVSKLTFLVDWVQADEQRGLGLISLAVIVGECGDLNNYPKKGHLFKRLGLAPFQFNGTTQMGSTWRAKKNGNGSLPASEWEAFGYSPRRRSIMYIIGENLMKLNKGPYRARYEEAKAKMKAEHPDYPDLRCHRHGMLCATKLMLIRLLQEWKKHAGVANVYA